MLAPRYFIYLAVGANGAVRLDLSSNLRIDASFLSPLEFREFIVLQPPQPIWIAEKALKLLRKLPQNDLLKRFAKFGPQIIKEIYPQKQIKIVQVAINELMVDRVEPPDEIINLLEGYCLLGNEIPELIKRNGWDPPWDIEDWLQYLYLLAKVQRQAAVSTDLLGLPTCRRCGATNGVIRDPCVFCGSNDCFTCTNCQRMGLSKSCAPLYSQPVSDNFPIMNDLEIVPELEFDLTPPQKRAAEELIKFLDSNEERFLVWAVCGGGKTEVSFMAVAKVLSNGGRVLFAIPRKDVVQELLPRFQKAFPGVDCLALYGGSSERFTQTAALTIATTHQCLRFYKRFDLIVLDEADAFPYQGSAILKFAVNRALQSNGKLIMMTATPEKGLIDQATSGKLPFVSIPARYHRHPLIIPELVKGELPKNQTGKWEPAFLVQQFLLENKGKRRKTLLFLPTIQLINQYGPLIVKWAARNGIEGDYIFAGSMNRNEAKEALQGEQLTFLVTSTILERGITIPNLDVLVLWADYESVFDCRTLVQMAGRVSRLGEPARVIFFAKTVSRAMKDCQLWVERMNQEGYHLGYLNDEEI